MLHVSLAPEQTWLGWLLHLTQAPRPFTLSVHVQATERYRERMAQKRRYKRLFGVNRGIEQRGRPLDPDARVHEEEAAELTDELATSTGAGIYRVSVYLALREPDGDPDDARRALPGTAARELSDGVRRTRPARAVRAGARCGARRCRSAATSPDGDAQVRQPQRRRQLPAVGTSLRQPRRDPARLRVARAARSSASTRSTRSTPTICC